MIYLEMKEKRFNTRLPLRLSNTAKILDIVKFLMHRVTAAPKSWQQTIKRPELCCTTAYKKLGTAPGIWWKNPRNWVILIKYVFVMLVV